MGSEFHSAGLAKAKLCSPNLRRVTGSYRRAWLNFIWLDCNRRKTRAVAICMHIRQLKMDENSVVREHLLRLYILCNGGHNCWSEIKWIRSYKFSSSRIVDGRTGVGAITKLLATKYRQLYTSIPYDETRRNLLTTM